MIWTVIITQKNQDFLVAPQIIHMVESFEMRWDGDGRGPVLLLQSGNMQTGMMHKFFMSAVDSVVIVPEGRHV